MEGCKQACEIYQENRTPGGTGEPINVFDISMSKTGVFWDYPEENFGIVFVVFGMTTDGQWHEIDQVSTKPVVKLFTLRNKSSWTITRINRTKYLCHLASVKYTRILLCHILQSELNRCSAVLNIHIKHKERITSTRIKSNKSLTD